MTMSSELVAKQAKLRMLRRKRQHDHEPEESMLPAHSPMRPEHAHILDLQRMVGNKAAQRMLAEQSPSLQRSQQVRGDVADGTPENATAHSENLKIVAIDQLMRALKIISEFVEAPSEPLDTPAKQKEWKRKMWKQVKDPNVYQHYKESERDMVRFSTFIIGFTRSLIDSLNAAELGVSDKELKKIQGRYNRQLNGFTPYYTQMANKNFLPNFKEGNQAWSRTCNMTSMAMTLNALGVDATNFNGDQALMQQIAQVLDPTLTTYDKVLELRMPDFLQLVVIYHKYAKAGGKDFPARVKQAQRLASGVISTTLEVFVDVAGLFDVERTKLGFIPSAGSKKKDITDPEKLKQYSAEKYKKQVQKFIAPEIDGGGQIISNMPGHYTRLENVLEDGIVIDDPANNGKNFQVNWMRANEKGYFRSFQVFKKK
jgi:hypothetical protein